MKRVKIIFSIFAVVSAAFTMQGQDVTDTLHVNRRSVDMRRLKVVTDSLIRNRVFNVYELPAGKDIYQSFHISFGIFILIRLL